MVETDNLVEKREELRYQLTSREYNKSLITLLVNKVNQFIQKLTRNREPLSFWYGAVIIALASLIISFSISILLGENFYAIPYPLRYEDILLRVSGAIIILAIMIGYNLHSEMVSRTLRNHIVNHIESYTDLLDLQKWVTTPIDRKKPFLFGLAFSIFFGPYLTIFISTIKGGFFGFGSIFFHTTISFLVGIVFYHALSYSSLPRRLSRYKYKLYTTDPSSSEMVAHLSNMFTAAMYIMAVVVALTTLTFAFFKLLILPGIIFLIFVGWGPLVGIFSNHQYCLAKIISKAKWKTLSELQGKIETLQQQEVIPSKDTLAHIRALIDYHEHIKDTRNSMVDLRAVLNFLNSLLLPLFAFLLGNLQDILELFA